MSTIKYPVYKPMLMGNEKKYVNDCLDSTWISSKGKYVNDFENKFAEYCDTKYAVSVCNGTVALHLALLALGVGAGDEVIVPTLTYIASVNAISYTGAKPVFVDSLEDTWQMNPEQIKRKISKNTKAVIAVHLYGHPCEMDEIVKLCHANNIFLIEDAAEAIGSKYNDKMVGGFGDIGTFSFYGNKTITTGEGGMLVTSDDTLFDRIQHIKGQGLAKHREYWHDIVGYNYRMTNICAAIGLAQLENIDIILEKKQQIANWYKQGLHNTKYVFHQSIGNVFHSYWMCSMLANNVEERNQLRTYLSKQGIETRPVFYPIHTMPMYSKVYEKHPVAEKLGWCGINLPSYPDLTEEEVNFIINRISTF